jgi:ABC-type transport system involved in multi-copper enzyme maturation permease subunit
MNPLVKKEIRLLLPGLLAVLALEVLTPWFLKDTEILFGFMPVVLYFGMIILALDSFGREFSLGTFSPLMSQPIERRQVWRTKITVLILASVLIFAAYFIVCGMRLHLTIADTNSVWRANPAIIRGDFHNSMIASVAVTLVAFTGGLWTPLLLRQVAAAFWIALLTPVGLLFLIALVMSKSFPSTSDTVDFSVLYGAAGLYSLAGFWLAHRLFYRAQDAAWTGGIIDFSRWRYFDSGGRSTASVRRRRPLAALLKKEFQLHSVSLICTGSLLALHTAVILMRKVHGHFEPRSMLGTVSEFYWALWLVMPFIVSCTTMAEELRLGVMEGQFCLPASRRFQFTLKFILTIVSGLLLGGCMPLLLEGMAALVGAPNPDFDFFNHAPGFGQVSPVPVVGAALGLSLAGIFASTLTKNSLQAMGIAVVTIIGCCLFTYFAGNFHSLLGVTWQPLLTLGIAVLTALVVFPLLTYRNFKYFQEHGRMWRRNVWGFTGTILFIFISSAIVYNRVWEVFEPAEPAHGPAKLSLANPPVIRPGDYYTDEFLVQLPDGRVWYDRIGFRHSRYFLLDSIRLGANPFPSSIGPERFVTDSNWVSYAIRRMDHPADAGTHIIGYLETVGIKSDGTLWVSDKSDSPLWSEKGLTRFGDETNWQALAGSTQRPSVLLLKKDGTLWRWDTGTNQLDLHKPASDWPELRNFNPHQVGTNSDWRKISFNNNYLQKADGSVWSIRVWTDPMSFYHAAIGAAMTVPTNAMSGDGGTVPTNSMSEYIQATSGVGRAVPAIPKAGEDRVWRDTNWDQVNFESIPKPFNTEYGTFVHKDGTLWGRIPGRGKGSLQFETFQRGKETNWISVASSGWSAGEVALKSDGTLWQIDSKSGDLWTSPPIRLGIHDDWVAIAGIQIGVVSLAADGSLWLWPERRHYEYQRTLLKLPKQPQFLGNIFGKSD